MKRKSLLLVFCILLIKLGWSQDKLRITGNVTDEQGPLAGVSVSIKGKAGVGTASTASGDYSISASEGDILMFTMLGYKTEEVKVANQKGLTLN